MASSNKKKRMAVVRQAVREASTSDSVAALRGRVAAEMQARRERDIARHGWQAMWVGRTQGDPPDQPVWCYTIGLHGTTGGPELIIFGLPGEASHSILSVLADRLKAGEQFVAGRFYEGVLQRLPVFLGAVPASAYAGYVQQAINQYGGQPDFPLFQVVWPDKNGRFPWDAEAEDYLAGIQPVLCPPPGEASDLPTP